MSWNMLISLLVLTFAVTGFCFLAWALWSRWEEQGWMSGPTKRSDARSSSLRGSSWAWEENECYRECMDDQTPGTGNQHVYCANACGLQ